MDVLIKGMKMPTEGKVMTIYKFKGEFYASLNGTELCPLIELPDHGDLIDRDAVVAWLADWSKGLIETYGENDEYVTCLSEVIERLGCEDVIIPAERSEE